MIDPRPPERTPPHESESSWRDREALAEAIACRLDGVMTVAGILFVLIVLGQSLVPADSPAALPLTITGWVLWVLFATEFLARMAAAPSTARFLRSNWWQVLFLLVPFLRFARPLAVARYGRAGTVVSSAVRSGRSTRGLLTSRIAYVISITGIVVLAASQLLYTATTTSFSAALHAATYAVLTGEPIPFDGTFVRLLELALAAYSVVVFAALAASLGAYFVAKHQDEGS